MLTWQKATGRILPCQKTDIFPPPAFTPGHSPLLESPAHSKLAHLWTDVFFTCPMRATLAARQRHLAPTWHYRFSATPTCPASEVGLKARHTAELFFVFGLKEDLPPPDGNCSMTEVGGGGEGGKREKDGERRRKREKCLGIGRNDQTLVGTGEIRRR